ncbi:hypothetical protein TB2_030438 [Malus domestica]
MASPSSFPHSPVPASTITHPAASPAAFLGKTRIDIEEGHLWLDHNLVEGIALHSSRVLPRLWEMPNRNLLSLKKTTSRSLSKNWEWTEPLNWLKRRSKYLREGRDSTT